MALGNAFAAPDMAAIVATARDAGLDDVVSRLPGGWDTPLARACSGGVDLSGGQWQQVVLARALYAMRTGARVLVLVLDEPTALILRNLPPASRRDMWTRVNGQPNGQDPRWSLLAERSDSRPPDSR